MPINLSFLLPTQLHFPFIVCFREHKTHLWEILLFFAFLIIYSGDEYKQRSRWDTYSKNGYCPFP